MGRQDYWNATRVVGENIHAGDRSRSNMMKNPRLPSSGWGAIKELEEEGMITVMDDRVEPTPTFWPWLEALRSAETEQAIARQKEKSAPWQAPAPTPEPGKAPLAASTALDELSSSSSATQARAAGSVRRRPVKRPDLFWFDEMCVRIIDFMRHYGHRVTYSNLRRGLNAYRYGEMFDRGFQKLQGCGAIELEKEHGSRRQWVTLLEIPKKFEATRPKPKQHRHRPGSRGQTAWFQNLMAQRKLED